MKRSFFYSLVLAIGLASMPQAHAIEVTESTGIPCDDGRIIAGTMFGFCFLALAATILKAARKKYTQKSIECPLIMVGGAVCTLGAAANMFYHAISCISERLSS